MSVGVGAQGVDLIQSMPFYGYESEWASRENLTHEPVAGGEINYPWLISLSSQMGNALTASLATTAHVFSEPEWGFECAGPNQNWQGAMSRPGGISISW